MSQHARRIEVFRREGDHWTYREHGAGQRVELASLGVAIAVDDVYRDPLAELST